VGCPTGGGPPVESPPGEDPPFGGGSEANMKSKFDAYNSDEEIPSGELHDQGDQACTGRGIQGGRRRPQAARPAGGPPLKRP
jgi:hypothetical protein